ncbi:hypothetical protein HN709_03380 [Candidatus Peregrinibacteria bacterium]|jgi:hypothetical protein|nr:hypothetical protein [Candidatus Peregrinibacteria bacterium]MBT7736707.1 hypothetical protein [Candidatus Peregrinibacteria bacterium]
MGVEERAEQIDGGEGLMIRNAVKEAIRVALDSFLDDIERICPDEDIRALLAAAVPEHKRLLDDPGFRVRDYKDKIDAIYDDFGEVPEDKLEPIKAYIADVREHITCFVRVLKLLEENGVAGEKNDFRRNPEFIESDSEIGVKFEKWVESMWATPRVEDLLRNVISKLELGKFYSCEEIFDLAEGFTRSAFTSVLNRLSRYFDVPGYSGSEFRILFWKEKIHGAGKITDIALFRCCST